MPHAVRSTRVPAEDAGPVFVGGTGRSATGVVARLIGHHRVYATIPSEVRFHADPGGLVDLLERRVDLDWFLDVLRRHWFAVERHDDRPAGLRRVCPAGRFELAVATFEEEFPFRPLPAARSLMQSLLDPVAEEAGARWWVEHTPTNLATAAGLSKIFPTARFIHCVRDGADVACSVAGKPWGPESPVDALLWWHDRFQDAVRGERHVSHHRVHRVNLDWLVGGQRESEWTRLMRFLPIDDDPAVRAFFDQQLTPARANIARWRDDVPPAERAEFDEMVVTLGRHLDAIGLRPPATTVTAHTATSTKVRVAVRLKVLRWTLWERKRWRWRPTRWWRLVRSAKVRHAGRKSAGGPSVVTHNLASRTTVRRRR